jgi:hypothetical protein
MKKVKTGLLRPNKITASIYGDRTGDANFSTLRNSIELEGILEPLVITSDFFIISGVRRYFAALDLGLEEVPVVISPVMEAGVDEYNSQYIEMAKPRLNLFLERGEPGISALVPSGEEYLKTAA